MKYKQNNDGPKKPKSQLLSEKGKFKKKNTSTTNGKVEKGVKIAAEVLKKAPVKGQNESPSKGTVIDKTKQKQRKLNSAQLGMLVDAYLDKKKSEVDLTPNSPDKSAAQNDPSPGSGVSKLTKGKNKQANVAVDKSPIKSPQRNIQQAKPTVTKKKKRGNKRQATVPTAAMELEDSSGEVMSKKTKQQNRKGKVEMKKKLEASTSDNPDYELNPKDVLNAVNAALELHTKKLSSSKKLLDADPEPIFLNLLFHYAHPRTKVMKFDLNHSLVTDSNDICLFVSDVASSSDESLSKWKELLKKNEVTRISEVIPLRTLRKEYTQFDNKRKLGSRFDIFLVEKSIYSRVFSLVGNKHFHSRRKTPIPVQLDGPDMKKNIESALAVAAAQYKAAVNSFSIQVGHTAMENKKIQENVLKVWEDYPKHFGVFWDNIKRASLLLRDIPDLPIFCSLAAPEGSPRIFNNLIWAKGKGEPVIGELSSKMDQKVLVYPSGSVIVKSPPVTKKSPEEVLAKKLAMKEKKKAKKKNKAKNVKSEEDMDSDDDIGGRADMLEFETDSDEDEEEMETDEEEVKPEGKAGTIKVKNNQQAMKGNKEKQNQKEEEDSVVDKAEEAYMTALAAAKKLQPKSQKGKNVEVKHSSDSDGASDASEDDDDLDGSDDSMDEMAIGSDSSNEESMEDSDNDEEEPKPLVGKKIKGKQGPNPKAEVQKGQPGKKFNKGNQNQSGGKKQNQKFQNKPGAQKSSPVQKGKNFNKKNAQPSTQVTGGEKTNKQNKISFQGVKADNNKKKNRNKSQIKNKLIAKKMK